MASFNDANIVVRSEVIQAGFGFYTDKDLEQLSVCQVTSPISFDSLGHALPGGLLDPRMGATDMKDICRTCNSNSISCLGHPGHVKLDVSVYHPFLFAPMFTLLKTKCVGCHKFRTNSNKTRQLLLKLKLLEMGDTDGVTRVDDICAASAENSSANIAAEESEAKSSKKASTKKDRGGADLSMLTDADIEAEMISYETKYKMFISKPNRQPAAANFKAAQAKLIDEFYRNVMKSKKCENCGGFSPAFRRDGYAKIFQKALPKKYQVLMNNMNMKIRSALEEAQEDDDDDDDDGYSDDDNEDSDNDDGEGDGPGRKKKGKKVTSSDKFLVPSEVEMQISLLWKTQVDFLDFVWSRATNNGIPHSVPDREGHKLFFIRVILVPPNRFRPTAVVGESSSEHPQNIHLSKIINANEKIRLLYNVDHKASSSLAMDEVKSSDTEPSDDDDESVGAPKALTTYSNKASILSRLSTEWIELQNSVNCYMDSAKDPNVLANQSGAAGIRQLLERKEGLFRMNMMGKRVNYCCRSVISPDPFLGTNEIGIPLQFAKTLHYPVPVNDWNVKYLRTLVERGPHEYPGANIIETPTGAQIKLEKLSASERSAKAKLLLSSPGYKVFRHLIDGDLLLVNRQPTLHKPGIMSHKARVYKAVKEQTLRMHYANCNSYNADFDGDEMNCHFVQNEIARAEATLISNTDNQYIVPTSGNPLRGLIQDHVTAAVKMTSKNTFFNKFDFQQLVYIAVSGLAGTEIVTASDEIEMPTPTILKPKELWTGKQVISCLISHLCNMAKPKLQPLNLDGGTKTPAAVYGTEENEHFVIFRHGCLLQGTLDKAAIGNVSLGIVHAVYELYGPEYARTLLNAFGRLFTFYLQDAGHTCSIEDLILVDSAEAKRKHLLDLVNRDSALGIREFLSGLDQNSSSSENDKQELSAKDIVKLQDGVADLLSIDKTGKQKLDGAAQGYINRSASQVIKACLQTGLKSPFLRNNFAIMVLTGAKGSTVNQSLITCFLGQQALEGQRVPIMASGKSLPSFRAYDISPRANGFVRDRFLTGIRPQEFYFHCMAGREGLVDTAVKTSRSGYLQRCLVKHLEELKVAYDNTVRDSGQNVIQFLYGEDGLDACNSALFGAKSNQMLFMARNNQVLMQKLGLSDPAFLDRNGMEINSASNHHKLVAKAKELAASKTKLADITKGCCVLARRKIDVQGSWKVSNLSMKWEPALVTKVRRDNRDSVDNNMDADIGGGGGLEMTVDLKFSDDHVEKKVPLKIFAKLKSKSSAEGALHLLSENGRIPCDVVKIGLPSTSMNSLNINRSVGAVSEKMQDFLTSYVKKNPDGVIDSQNCSSTMVTKESLEYLMWIKYMRALAAPGEAVGCVAAQSIGEPSTQMTLNTFHLAGHGAGNVTLGIPRLREIIMTASTKPKTPNMMIPLQLGQDMAAAKALARKLSRLSLSQLLSHKGGIEVVEVETLINRVYRIKLIFEKLSDIARTFGITFDELSKIVAESFIPKLMYWIRRSGEKSVVAPAMDIEDLKSKVKGSDELGRGGRGSNSADTGDDNDNNGDKEGGDGDTPRKGARDINVVDALLDGSDDDDEDDDDGDDDDNNELGGKKGTPKRGSKGEISGYDELDEIFGSQDADEFGESMDRDKSGFGSDSEHGSGSDDDAADDDEMTAKGGAKKVNSKGKATAPAKKAPAKREKSSNKSLNEVAFDEQSGSVEMNFTFPTQNRRLLMVQLAEKAASQTAIRQTKNIAMAYPVQDEKNDNRPSIATEGVNFEEIWDLPESLVDHNKVRSNDVYGVSQVYGVEAARQSIVNEMSNVFGAYGIDVNPRHLSLIADFMTRKGGYIPMNRIGMTECPSTLLQMSFETTCTFLMKAAMEGKHDDLESPSSRIVLGSVIKVGTGCFDVTAPII